MSAAFGAKPSPCLNWRDVKQSKATAPKSGAGNGDRSFRVCRIKASPANLTVQRTVETTSKARAAPSLGTE
jgi:hypothetical protein